MSATNSSPNLSAHHPIPPASEPKQFRAIGLVQAQYQPSEESFTRGFLKTEDGHLIDAVLLGRVMSLVKKHIDLDQSHLWVVYPRTREKQHELHVQIVGVWEPETLAQVPGEEGETDESSESSEPPAAATAEETAPVEEQPEEVAPVAEASTTEEPDSPEVTAAADSESDRSPATNPAATESSSPQLLSKPKLVPPMRPVEPVAPPAPPAPAPAPVSVVDPQDGYFSIRGEVIGVAEDQQQITVRIQQAPRKSGAEAKAFRLILCGSLDGKLIGHFWDLHVRRHQDQLVIEEGTRIGIAPPRHKPKAKAPKKKKKQNLVKVKRKDQRTEGAEATTEATATTEGVTPETTAISVAPEAPEATEAATPAADVAAVEAPATEPEQDTPPVAVDETPEPTPVETASPADAEVEDPQDSKVDEA
ncbi:MAG TPA: hypothetical protein V6D20_08935 [Candidatus Obscuribacterales bacterium]